MQSVTIGQDGTISGALIGQPADQIAALNRILLTNPPDNSLRGAPTGCSGHRGQACRRTPRYSLQVGALEGSNADTGRA